MVEKVEQFKNGNELLQDVHVVGRTSYATIEAKTSVNNLQYFNQQLVELEEQNEESKVYNRTKPAIKMRTLGTKITRLKQKIEMLEEMDQKAQAQQISEASQKLIYTDEVTQWKKRTIYYFVKGLKKVALELDDNGEFQPSNRYPAYDEKDQNYLKELLGR